MVCAIRVGPGPCCRRNPFCREGSVPAFMNWVVLMTALWITSCAGAGYRLRGLGDPDGNGDERRQCADAGDIRRGARGCAGLSQAAIHHDRHRRHRHLRDRQLFPRLAGGDRLRYRCGAFGTRRLHRHERLGARQCAHCTGGDQLARGRFRDRLQGRCDHGNAGGELAVLGVTLYFDFLPPPIPRRHHRTVS